MGELVGYARVSTEDKQCHSMEMQIAALKQAGCIRVFQEKASGGNRDREIFKECISFLRSGDTLVLYHSNRLARDAFFTLEIRARLSELGVELVSIMDPIDLTTPHGRCMHTITAALSELERDQHRILIKDRLARARERGTILGRKRKIAINDRERLLHLVALHKSDLSISYIGKEMGMHHSTVYRTLAIAKKLGYYPEYQLRGT